MKPPETVTLIDLEGNIVVSFAEFADSNSQDLINQHFTNLRMEEIDHFTDQLTFIRNGMWETLAIYQATLGKYWEVPWYKVDYFKTPDGRESITKCKNVHLPSGYIGTVYQPTYSQFLKHYPDVFSQLTPYEGE
jgi:hypothetical protein